MAEMKAVVLSPDERQQIEEFGEQGAEILRHAHGYEVAEPADFEALGRLVAEYRRYVRTVKDFFEPMRKSAQKVKDDILQQRNMLTDPFEEAIEVLTAKGNTYRKEQKRLAEEAARKAREEELARQKAEAEAAALAAAQAGDELAFEQAARAAQAAVAPSAGPSARELLEQRAPKVKGQRVREVWEANLSHPESEEAAVRALCAYIASGGPTKFVVVDLKAIAEAASSMGGLLNVPGVAIERIEKVDFTSGR